MALMNMPHYRRHHLLAIGGKRRFVLLWTREDLRNTRSKLVEQTPGMISCVSVANDKVTSVISKLASFFLVDFQYQHVFLLSFIFGRKKTNTRFVLNANSVAL